MITTALLKGITYLFMYKLWLWQIETRNKLRQCCQFWLYTECLLLFYCLVIAWHPGNVNWKWCHEWLAFLHSTGLTSWSWGLPFNIASQRHDYRIISRDPFINTDYLLIVWISNYINHNVCDEILYPFPNACTIEIWNWIRNFISHVIRHVITYPFWD